MKCPRCNKPIKIQDRVYANLEFYSVGKSALTSSECCGIGMIVKMNVSYTVTPYQGKSKIDDWGVEITHPTEETNSN